MHRVTNRSIRCGIGIGVTQGRILKRNNKSYKQIKVDASRTHVDEKLL